MKWDTELRHIKNRRKCQPLCVDLCTVQLKGKICIPLLQSVPDVTAAHTTSEHRRKTDAQFSGQCKQIVTEHPQRLMAVCDQDMPLRRICMLLHRLRMFYRILVKIQYHLCLWVKILPCRGQHDPAWHMLKQFKLQLTFQSTYLL